MGDFEVVNVNGRLQKNGGNVATYFCTPDGRVVHAVGQAVQPERLLREARWAVETYKHAKEIAPELIADQRRVLEEAHLSAIGSNQNQFVSLVQHELPRANQDYQHQWQAVRQRRSSRSRYASYRTPEILRVSAETTARRRAARRLGGTRAHQILAAQPLPKLSEVERLLFEQLTGEKANERRGPVYSASQTMKHARENNLPLLLVFYNGHGENKDEYDSAMRRLVDGVMRMPTVNTPLKSFAVVTLPIRQIAALSNLVDVSPYELPGGSRPALIIAKPNGEAIGSLSGNIGHEQLAARLWPHVHNLWLTRAARLALDGNHPGALRLLRKVQIQSHSSSTRDRAVSQINDVNMELARQWAERGNKTGAIRLLNSVITSSVRDDIRTSAEEQIAQLR